MKKLFGWITAAAVAASLIPGGIYAMDESGIGEVYYQNDFSTEAKVSEMSASAQFSEGTMIMPAYGSAYTLKFGDKKLPSLNSASATIEIKLAFKSKQANWMGYMLGLVSGANATGARVRLGYDDYKQEYKITALKDGTNNWDESLVSENSMPVDTWHKICMAINNGSYDLYLDGDKITTSSLDLNSAALTGAEAIIYMNNRNYCAAHFDDILVKETGTMALRDSSIQDGATEVPVSTEAINLTFENPLAPSSAETVKINGLAPEDYSVAIDQVNDARTAVITLNDSPLSADTVYSVEYNAVDYMGQAASGSISFTTEAQVTPPEPVETTVETVPVSGASGVNSYSPVTFTYNKVIDEASVPTELTLSNGRKAFVSVSGKTITVLPVNPPAFSESLTVTLPDTIIDANGEPVPESTVTYTTMEDSVYYEHIFRDRENSSQTTSEFPDSPYLVSKLPVNISDAAKGNGLVVNDDKVVLVYKLDQGIDRVEAMEYFGTSREGAGSAAYYIGNTADNIVSEENVISPSETVDDTYADKLFTKKVFKGDGTKKYFAVEVTGKSYLPQLQYLKFNYPKTESVTANVPTAEGNSVIFELNSRIDPETVSADKFKVNGESVLAANAAGNKLTLIFSALDSQKTYTVTSEGVTDVYGNALPEMRFITPKAVKVVSARITEGSLNAGGSATAEVVLKNTSLSSKQTVKVVSAYYNDIEMKQAQLKTEELAADEEKTIVLESLDVTSAEKTDFVKIFVWLDETMQPVDAALTITGSAQ